MKFRPVLLVVLLLSGFYYVTTHGAAPGKSAPWLRAPAYAPASDPQTKSVAVEGTHSAFNLTEASAAPAFAIARRAPCPTTRYATAHLRT